MVEQQQGLQSLSPPDLLCGCPRTFSGMWDEYQNGVGGRKSAREFTSRAERGQKNAKFEYSRRIIVWKCIKMLVDKGKTLSTAFTQIREVYYDNCNRTQLINNMRNDERQ